MFQLGAWPLPVQKVVDNLRAGIPTSQQAMSSSPSAGLASGEAPFSTSCLSWWIEAAELGLESQLCECGVPAPSAGQVQGCVWLPAGRHSTSLSHWDTCEGSSPSAEQVFARRLCWDFLRAQAMHAWSETHWDCCLGLQKGSCFHFLTLSLLWRGCKICSQILPHPWTIRPGVRD